jgi:hypothetical protein
MPGIQINGVDLYYETHGKGNHRSRLPDCTIRYPQRITR